MHENLLSLLADSGHASTGCSRGVLKRRIESHFGSRIEFIRLHAANQSLLLLSSTLEKQHLLEAYVKLFKETHKEDLNYDYGDLHNVGAGEQTADKSSLEVFHCAHTVRPDLLSVPDAGAWPPFPDSLSRDMASCMVPTSLYNWLAVVFLGNTVDLNADRHSRLSPVPEAIHGRILLIAHDILYTTRRGRIVTPKHVLLSSTVHHLTPSAQLVTILNHFGHGIAMSQLEEMNTALAIVWRTQAPAPSALMQHILVRCGCTGGCKSARCKCYRENVQCTDVCSCSASCTNKPESALNMVLQPPKPDSGDDSGKLPLRALPAIESRHHLPN